MNFSVRSISMNHFVIKPALNRSNRRLNRRTRQTVWFFANRPHLNPKNICLLFKKPIIHQAHSTPNTYKTKTNYKSILGPSRQAQSNDKKAYNMFGLNITFLFGSCFQAQFAGLFGLKACWKVFIEHMEYIKFMCFRCGIGNETDQRKTLPLDAQNFEVFEL